MAALEQRRLFSYSNLDTQYREYWFLLQQSYKLFQAFMTGTSSLHNFTIFGITKKEVVT